MTNPKILSWQHERETHAFSCHCWFQFGIRKKGKEQSLKEAPAMYLKGLLKLYGAQVVSKLNKFGIFSPAHWIISL